MRSRDFHWIVALIGSLGFLAFLAFGLWETIVNPKDGSSSLVHPSRVSVANSSFELEQNKQEELFLVSYQEEELSYFRDLFNLVTTAFPEGEETVKVLPQEPGKAVRKADHLSSSEGTGKPTAKEEPFPPIKLQGVVVSNSGQAVVVEVGGRVKILTDDINSLSKVKLVRVENKEVVLSYEGREIRLTLEE